MLYARTGTNMATVATTGALRRSAQTETRDTPRYRLVLAGR
jgi:hypothetical protein